MKWRKRNVLFMERRELGDVVEVEVVLVLVLVGGVDSTDPV